MTSQRTLSLFLLTFVLLLAASTALHAQAVSARLEGLVQDSTEAVIPGVTVVATHVDTNLTYEVISNETGLYIFANLSTGTYTLSAELAGFKRALVTDIVLRIGDSPSINIVLEPGGITETVTVTGITPLINTATSKIGAVVENRQAVDLPLNGRDAMMLFYLQAGTNPIDRLDGSGSQQQQGVVDGLAPHTSAVKVEGIMASNPGYDYSPAHPSTPVPQEAVGEYRVTTSGDLADAGRGSGAQVKVALKSGTNEFHGSVFLFNRNTAYNANNFFNNRGGQEKPELKRNQFGFAVGGPIIKNRTFFFLTVEFQRQTQDTVENRFVYTQALRDGTFRFYKKGNNSSALVDANGNPTVPAEDIGAIDILNVDPTRLGKDTFFLPTILGVMPAPNNYDLGDGFNTAGYRYNSERPENIDQYLFKIDHQLNNSNQLSFSYSRNKMDNPHAALINGVSPEGFTELRRGGSLRWITSFSPSMTNELSVGGNLRLALRPITNPDQLTEMGSINLDGLGTGSGLTGNTNGNIHIRRGTQSNPSVNLGFSDTLSWIVGNHTLNMGGEFWYQTLNRQVGSGHFPETRTTRGSNPADIPNLEGLSSNDRNRAGQLTNDITGAIGTSRQVFYLTNPQGYGLFTNNYQQLRKKEYSLYIQDVWKIRPTFTLNMGIRYEMMPTPYINNVFGYPVLGVDGALGIQGPTGQPTEWGFAPNQGRNIINNDWNNFGPHLGFSWDPFGDGKTGVRGSYRVAYDRFMMSVFGGFSSRNYGATTSIQKTPFDRLSNLSSIVPIPAPAPFAPLGNVRQSQAYVGDPNMGTPYVQSWTFGIERQLHSDWKVDVSYVGNHAVGMWRGANFNQNEIRQNGFLDAFKIAQQNLATNGNPAIGEDLGALQPLFELTPSSQYGLITRGEAAGLSNFFDTTTLNTGNRGGLLGLAGLSDTFFRFNSQIIDLDIIGNRSHSTFHGMKLGINRRLNAGLYLQANYTLGKALTDNVPGQNLASDYRDNANHKLDKGISRLDSTHVLLMNGIWELPFGKGRMFLTDPPGWVDAIVGGWQINGIYNFSTGRALGVTTGRNLINNTTDSTPDFSGDFKNLSDVNKGAQITYLSTSQKDSFSNPSAGEVGGLPIRGPFHTPGVSLFDMSFFKRFALGFLTEDSELQIRVEFFNIFNHTNWRLQNPTTNMNSGSFGVISRAWEPRIGQLALKYVF